MRCALPCLAALTALLLAGCSDSSDEPKEEYVLAGQADGTGVIFADDDLEVYVDGELVSAPDTNCSASDWAPFTIRARKGDSIVVRLFDCTGAQYAGRWELGDVYLVKGDQSVLVAPTAQSDGWFYADGVRLMKVEETAEIPF